MGPVLLVEIVTACVAFVCLVPLVALNVRRGAAIGRGEVRVPGWHLPVAVTLCACAVAHGAAAMAYASGASVWAYVLGWCSLVAFVVAGGCMCPPLRGRLGERGAFAWHMRLFLLGVALVVAHAVAGRI